MTVTQDRTAVLSVAGAAQGALDQAVGHLIGLQHEQGWWQGELETNVTMDAEDLLLREFLGVRTPDETSAAARWIRSCQGPDGTWANFRGGDADLSTTVEAYVALRLAGDKPDADHMSRAAAWIRSCGGIAATRVFTRIWLALFGEWSWDDLPVMPPEMIFLPAWFPLNVYDWACWARQTIVPLTVVGALRPVRPLAFGLTELRGPASAAVPPVSPAGPGGLDRDQGQGPDIGAGQDEQAGPAGRAGQAGRDAWAGLFGGLDRALHIYHRRGQQLAPTRAVRAAALRRCAEWIIARQERDGCWGGIQPPWVYSLIALHLLGYGLDHPVISRGLSGLDRYTIWEDSPDGPVRRLEACQSPVWDTVLAIIALADAGLPPDHPRLRAAAGWVLDEEIQAPGDWQVRRPALPPAGNWAFEFDNDGYPDIDDTAEVVLALRRVTWPDDAACGPAAAGQAGSGRARQSAAAAARAVRWLTGMQSRDGGWGAFDADNTSTLVTKLPFCDFGEVIDPPSADVTAHTVEALAAEGLASSRAARRGVAWLLRAQESDGSWFGRWGANYVYGTGAVLPALIAAGVRPGKPAIRRAVAWLVAHQNPDGGWGEDLRSYTDRGWAGRGESTASQTAWALLALLAADPASAGSQAEREAQTASTDRGVRWLTETQRPDGTWDEPQYTGTGFPGAFYINYHLYRLVFPVSALGRYLNRGQAARSGEPAGRATPGRYGGAG
jgi:squalene-hopene/tetraprenyl-beta-curcumene cyclase